MLNIEPRTEYFGTVFLPPCMMHVWGEGYSLREEVYHPRILIVDSNRRKLHDRDDLSDHQRCVANWVMVT